MKFPRPALKPWSGVLLLMLVVICNAMLITSVHAQNDGSPDFGNTDDPLLNVQLETLNYEQLEKLLANLTDTTELERKRLPELQDELRTLMEERMKTDKETESMNGAKLWEQGEKNKVLTEEKEFKEKIMAEQERIAKTVIHIQELSREIAILQNKQEQLASKKSSLAKKYYEPKVEDMLEEASKHWSPVTRQVYERTKALMGSYDQIKKMQHKVPKVIFLIIFMMMYGFVAAGIYGIFHLFARVRPTVSKMILTGDALLAVFWFLMTILHVVLRVDPLYVMNVYAANAFTLFQVFVLTSYVFYALLRVYQLAAKLSIMMLGELLAVIVVGNHFYVRAFLPLLLNVASKPSSNLKYYFCYFVLFVAFAANKLQTLSPLKPMGSGTLSYMQAWNIVFQRFMNPNVPVQDPSISSNNEEDALDLFSNIRTD